MVGQWVGGWVGCFTSRSRIFHLYGNLSITDEGLQNSGLCSALRAFKQGGIFMVQNLLCYGILVFPVSSNGLPHSIASYESQGNTKDLFLPRSSRIPIQSPFTTRKGMLRTYSHAFELMVEKKIQMLLFHSKKKKTYL
jgi:hypothetical protein